MRKNLPHFEFSIEYIRMFFRFFIFYKYTCIKFIYNIKENKSSHSISKLNYPFRSLWMLYYIIFIYKYTVYNRIYMVWFLYSTIFFICLSSYDVKNI